MATGKLQYKLTPLAEKMAEEKGYSDQPQEKLDKDLFNELLKRKDIATLMFNGGTDLTRDQLKQTRELIAKTPKKKLQAIAKSLEGTVGYQNLLSLPIVSKILETKKKKIAASAPAPVVAQPKPEEPVDNPSDAPADKPAEEPKQAAQPQEKPAASPVKNTASPQLKKKDPNYSNVVSGALKPLMKGDSAANILGKMYNFLRMEHTLYLKNLQEDKKLRGQLETIKENRNAELIQIFSGKKVPQKEVKKANTKGTEPKKPEPTNQTAQKATTEIPKQTANKVPEASSTAGSMATKVAIGAGAAVAAGSALGRVSEKYESGGRGVGTISDGNKGKDPGGVSYGKYQLSSKTGTMAAFLNSKEGKPFSQKFGSAKPGTPEFNKIYTQVVRDNGQEFDDAQHKYIEKTLYKPVEKYAASKGLNVNDSAMKEALFSQSVQHGFEGNTIIIDKAVQISKNESNSNTQAKAKALYRARIEYVNSLKSLDPKTKRDLIDRYRREQKDIEILIASNENDMGSRLDASSKEAKTLKQQTKAGGINVSVLNNNTNVINGGDTYQNPEATDNLPSALAKQYKS